MNLYLRDKEKFQEGVLAERARANRELQAERERAKIEALSIARSFLGITSPEIIASNFGISVEKLLEQQPYDNTPKV